MKLGFSLIKSTLLVASCAVVLLASADHGPCHADREKFCKDVKVGEGRLVNCMKENQDKLSTECKAQREKMKDLRKEVHEACEDDVQAHCGDIKVGGGAVMKCIKEHHEKLSEGCKSAWGAKKDMRKMFRKK